MTKPSLLERAQQSIEEAHPRAQADPSRPQFHFTPPAMWMNDPNGTIHYQGWYHLFYQLQPFHDHPPKDDDLFWGHARSQDLVHWEHLPIALVPDREHGEYGCWSGGATVDGEGNLVLIYTSVQGTDPDKRPPFEQWGAVSRDGGREFTRHAANPLLCLDDRLHLPQGPRVLADWRDPFVFDCQDRKFMVVGNAGPEAGTPLFEAVTPDLGQWVYRGQLCDISAECPNFFPLQDRFVYLLSPFGDVEYRIGTLDLAHYRFHIESEGIVEASGGYARGFYASNVLRAPDGRCILLGWLGGFEPGHGWNGCLALPRVLSISADLELRQHPIDELRQLRGKAIQVPGFILNEARQVLVDVVGDQLEIKVRLTRISAAEFGLNLRCEADGTYGVSIHVGPSGLEVAGKAMDIPLGDTLDLHVFLDRSVLEVFVNDGQACASRVIDQGLFGQHVMVWCKGGMVAMEAMTAWPLRAMA